MKTLLIFISVEETGEKLQNFLWVLSKIEEKDKITENSYAMFQIKVVLIFQCFWLGLAN